MTQAPLAPNLAGQVYLGLCAPGDAADAMSVVPKTSSGEQTRRVLDVLVGLATAPGLAEVPLRAGPKVDVFVVVDTQRDVVRFMDRVRMRKPEADMAQAWAWFGLHVVPNTAATLRECVVAGPCVVVCFCKPNRRVFEWVTRPGVWLVVFG